MRHTILLGSVFFPLACTKTAGELCSGTAELSNDGNWYCSEVWAITYRNISQAGAYNRTTSVDPRTGLCGHERLDYPGTGPLTPLFGDVSIHLRGPMNVSQLAVYQLPDDSGSMKKRSTVPFYNRRRALKRKEDSIDDKVSNKLIQTLKANLFPLFKRWTYSATPSRKTVTSTVTIKDRTMVSMPILELDTTAISKRDNVHVAAADWSRIAYYTSVAPAQATGLSFLANLGDPQKSGTFDYAFGNSLGYVTPDGGKVASESLPFNGTLDTSEREIAVFSDKSCDHDCPYWRPNATSHYGWSGSSKAFFIEFQMDHYQNHGTDQGLISDAPAYWFLNAAIPRILQYGNDRNNIPCSCWSTGCGEFDAFEVLGTGEERAKSTMHRQGNLEGGDSNYFKRPVGSRMKFAVVWHFPHITAMVLDDDFDFAGSLSDYQVQKLVQYDPNSWVHSLFAIGDS